MSHLREFKRNEKLDLDRQRGLEESGFEWVRREKRANGILEEIFFSLKQFKIRDECPPVAQRQRTKPPYRYMGQRSRITEEEGKARPR